MREQQIKIDPFQFITMQAMKIIRKVNAHAEAYITVQIKDKWEEQYIGILSSETWVKVTGINGQEGDSSTVHTVLFYGLVTDFSFSHDMYGTTMNLTLTSGTILMDLKPHFRVFQNKKYTM